MADEPVVPAVVADPPTDPPVVDPPVVDPPTPPVTGNEELSTLKERLARYEQLVISPEYAEFLAAKARNVSPEPEKPKTYTDEEKRAFQEKLNGMSRAEFAAFVRDLTVDTVREQMFAPVMQTIVSEKTQTQIAEAAAKHKDFFDYRPEMIALAKANPNLNAEQVYHLAKATKPGPKAPTGKPPVRTPSGEPPSGLPAHGKEKQPDNFAAAFDTAFAKSGL